MPTNAISWARLTDWALRALLGIVTALVIWALNIAWRVEQRLDELNTRVAVIEANRFTDEDGRNVYAELAEMQAVDAQLEAHYDDIVRRLGRIENKLDRLSGGME